MDFSRVGSRVSLFAGMLALVGGTAVAQGREKLSAGAIVADFVPTKNAQNVRVGAERVDEYLPMLKGKRVALLVNQTSRVSNTLLPDTLLRRGVNVVKLFVPEHGFRGTADAGAHVASGKDAATGLPIISLYGANKKPTAAQLKDVDIVVYDLQDVGVRFYTYISTLQYAMEACAENGKQILVLDRPNPHGFYIDGPVLDTSLRSFVGMQPVPVVYGMTAGEYAKMLVGERWFAGAAKCPLSVVPCAGYDHKTLYELPVPPSPNLKTTAAVLAYPSLCLFEGTVISVGRGTERPFEMYGHPSFDPGEGNAVAVNHVEFTPKPVVGATQPLYAGRKCFGYWATANTESGLTFVRKGLRVYPLLGAYQQYQNKGEKFFNAFFEKLAGTRELRLQVEAGMAEPDIRATWQRGLLGFKAVRKKYLLYADFE